MCLFSLDSHFKQACDKCRLFQASSFFYAMYSTFPEHVHHFVSLQSSPRGLERKEAHPELNEPFHEAMILLNKFIEVFTLSEFALGWHNLFCFQFLILHKLFMILNIRYHL
jgi:hypothetical protein